MKKNNKKGFFLSETMVVIAIVAVVVLSVFKLFNSVYYSFMQGENYNSVNAINALSNVQKYYESIDNIDTSLITEDISYVDLTNLEIYNSDYYDRLKNEFKIDKVYLIDLNKVYTSNAINDFNILSKKYLNTLKNVQGIVLVVSIDGKEFAYTQIENYQTVTLIGDKDDEFAVYVPIGGTFIDPGYKNWEGEEPTITWENDKEVDTNKAGIYYKYYDFNGYLLRRKIQVGSHTLAKYVDNLESLEESEEEVYSNGLYNPIATYDGKDYDTGIRYRGANPNNYVYFNCEDIDANSIDYADEGYDYKNSCEVWRIIGVFDVDNGKGNVEKRVKLVRDAFVTNMSWDSSTSGESEKENNSGSGINEWSQSDIQSVLNGYYIGVENATCKYCYNTNQKICLNDCTSSVTPILATSLNMVDDALWYTGATAYVETLPLFTMYAGERSAQSGKICLSGDYCNDSVTRTTEWQGKIGLIYPSDYAYASINESCAADIYGSNSVCNENNWLHPSSGFYWTITSCTHSSNASIVFGVFSSLRVGSDLAAYAYGIRPSLYLKSSIEIVSGSGTETSPYIIK